MDPTGNIDFNKSRWREIYNLFTLFLRNCTTVGKFYNNNCRVYKAKSVHYSAKI